ncbi:hypothetical protein [Limimaricola pyoseonensis]|nr:hypothetical protein [Limimaricola pyoseonensis]
MKRVAWAKGLGFGFGLFAPLLLDPAGPGQLMLVWGIVLWSVILGALVGLAAQFDRVPLFDLRLPAGLRGAWIGFWMGLVLFLVAGQGIEALWAGSGWLPQPPPGAVWLLVEATLVGAFIDLLAGGLAGARFGAPQP